MDLLKFKLLVLSFLSTYLLLPLNVLGQGGSIWYFGIQAGVNFNTSPPSALYNSAMSSVEGCATITDVNGNLLFYTNGLTVYNRLHQQMPNGYGLLGSQGSTQSAVVVPQPGNDSIYYIFTTRDSGAGTLRYSVVNMNLDNSLGDVTIKNEALQPTTSEQLTAVKIPGSTDYWVIGHELYNNYFNAFLIDATGINTSPFTTPIGPVITLAAVPGYGGDVAGQIKFSPDGVTLGQSCPGSNVVKLYDFDAFTATLSNERTLPVLPPEPPANSGPFGLEYSPSGRFLYCTASNKIYQWDLHAGTTADIIASRQIVGTFPAYLRALQVAQDGKIYVAKLGTFLGVINSPESPGVLCNYDPNAINLAPKQCASGLPTFIQSFYYIPFSIAAQSFCSGAPTQFSTQTNAPITNHLWHFGDSASGPNNTSTLATPAHTFSAPGQYTVSLTASTATDTFTQTLVVEILPAPAATVTPAGPVEICAGTTIHLQSAALPGLQYQWRHNGQLLPNDTLPGLTVSASGNYQLLVSDSVCTAASDTVQVTVLPQVTAVVSPAGPFMVCSGQSISLNAAQSTGSTFSWLLNGQPVSGANGLVFAASSQGNYQLIGSHNGLCPDTSAAVAVTVSPAPVAGISASGPLVFCSGDSVVLSAEITPGQQYQWLKDNEPLLGATGTQFTASSSGNYQLVVTNANQCRDTSANYQVQAHALPIVSITQIPGPNCPDPITLLATGASSYIWSTGAATAQITAQAATGNSYSVTGHNQQGCSGSDSVMVAFPVCAETEPVPNIITPNNDGVNDALLITLPGQQFDLQIFNRWGKEVYSRKNYQQQQNWQADGLADGLYFYFIKTTSGEEFKGWLEVLR